jgi:hypothetical protein
MEIFIVICQYVCSKSTNGAPQDQMFSTIYPSIDYEKVELTIPCKLGKVLAQVVCRSHNEWLLP